MKRKKIAMYIFLVLSVITAAAIFYFSNQSAEVSYSVTDNVVSSVTKAPVTQKEWDVKNELMVYVRKYAHVLIYGALSFFASMTIFFSGIAQKRKWYIRSIYALLICIAYSISDEIHQTFVPGRGASLNDILIDSMGIVCGISVSLLIQHFIHKKARKSKVTGE